MIFQSKFLNHVPFSTLRPRYDAAPILTAAQKAENELRQRLVSVDRLMYRGGNDRIFDTQTRRLFTGDVLIDSGDKFERILTIENGVEKSSTIRVKGGKVFQTEVVGGDAQKFEIDLSPEEIAVQAEKQLKADESFYQKMLDNFKKRKLFTIAKK